MIRSLFTISMLLAFGCSAPKPATHSLAYSESWFTCTGHFECVAVYDAFCRTVAVNSDYAMTYQDWTRQEVLRVGEGTVCPGMDFRPQSAGCRANRCVYPFGLEGYAKDPGAD